MVGGLGGLDGASMAGIPFNSGLAKVADMAGPLRWMVTMASPSRGMPMHCSDGAGHTACLGMPDDTAGTAEVKSMCMSYPGAAHAAVVIVGCELVVLARTELRVLRGAGWDWLHSWLLSSSVLSYSAKSSSAKSHGAPPQYGAMSWCLSECRLTQHLPLSELSSALLRECRDGFVFVACPILTLMGLPVFETCFRP